MGGHWLASGAVFFAVAGERDLAAGADDDFVVGAAVVIALGGLLRICTTQASWSISIGLIGSIR